MPERPTTDVAQPVHTSIRVIEPGRTEAAITHHASLDATADEVKAATNSCVVHLCGCS
jgi:hypothetical protein